MRVQPILVLVSGGQHLGPLAFATTAKGLQFTSCSGLLLTSGTAQHGVVLVPAAILRPWLQPGASWLASLGGLDPPSLVPDCGICAVGPSEALSSGAATCVPIATVRVPAISKAAAQLLRGLNRDAVTANWAFEWHIGGASCTAAEQGAFVLCWAQPLYGSDLGSAAAAAGLTPPSRPSQSVDPASSLQSRPVPGASPSGDMKSSSSSPAAAAAAAASCIAVPGPLSSPHCLRLLQSLLDALVVDTRISAITTSRHYTFTVAAAARGSGGGACGAPAPQRHGSAPCAAAASAEPPLGSSPGAIPGRLVSIVGSPFGCLAPFHFANAQINGAVACAFPAPPAATAPPAGPRPLAAPEGCAAAAAADCGCGLGPALYALDAHVFPGMEGALVTPLQLPLASLAAAPPRQEAPAGDCAASYAADAASCSGCGDAASGAAALAGWLPPPVPQQPLALLCTPVSRRADGVQVPLAAAWPHVAAALAGALMQLLRRALGPSENGDDVVAAGRRPAVGAGGAPERQQLQLQPVAARPAAGDAGCITGCADGGVSRLPRHGGAVSPSLCAAIAGCSCSVLPLQGGPGGATAAGGAVPPPPPPPGTASSLYAACGGVSLCGVAAAGRPASPAASRAAAAAAPEAASDGASASPAAAAAAASATSLHGPAPGAGGLPPGALQSVVLLRCNGSWATGVLVESRTGLLLTTAHLFQRQPTGQGSAGPPNGRSGKRTGGGGVGGDAHLPCWARVPWVSDVGGGGPACGACGAAAGRGPDYRWLRARVLYMWTNHLDLAVLQLEPMYGSHWAQPAAGFSPPAVAMSAIRETARARDEGAREVFASRRPPGYGLAASESAADGGGGGGREKDGGHAAVVAAAAAVGDGAWAPASRITDPEGSSNDMYGTYGAGSPVYAVGHSLVGPSAEWPALVSYGCVARVLRGRGGRPTMVLATTTTHAGGSGGALLDSAGRLVGLVTSNARHAGGATLPNMAFCIAAEELQPIMRWAAATAAAATGDSVPRKGPSPDPVSGPGLGLAALEAIDVADEDAARRLRSCCRRRRRLALGARAVRTGTRERSWTGTRRGREPAVDWVEGGCGAPRGGADLEPAWRMR